MQYSDLLVVLVLVAFVALSFAHVRWCEWMVGPDPVTSAEETRATASLLEHRSVG